MNSHIVVALTLLAAFAATAAAPGTTTVRVPRGQAAVIDGNVSATEWAGAFETELSAGSRLWLRHDGSYLYLAIRATSGYPSVCIAKGDTTRILHSSAALGTAAFVGEGQTRQLAVPFAYAMRRADTGSVRVAAQQDYIARNRWVASNTAMSQTDHEMQIDLSLFERSDPRLALGYYVLSPESAIAWPSGLADGCTALKVVQGWLPSTPIEFQPQRWARLQFD